MPDQIILKVEQIEADIVLKKDEKVIASSNVEGSLPSSFINDYLYFKSENDPIVEMVLIDMDDKKGWQNIHKSGKRGNIYPN